MRAFIKDTSGYLSVIEVDTIIAVTAATTTEECIQKQLQLGGPNDEVVGLYIVPTDDNLDEMFVPCEDVDEMMTTAFFTGMINLSLYDNVYDAQEWYLFT